MVMCNNISGATLFKAWKFKWQLQVITETFPFTCLLLYKKRSKKYTIPTNVFVYLLYVFIANALTIVPLLLPQVPHLNFYELLSLLPL